MAKTQSEPELTDYNDSEEEETTLFHDFVYRDDMSLDEVAEYLETDWEDAYNWVSDRLREAKGDYEDE